MIGGVGENRGNQHFEHSLGTGAQAGSESGLAKPRGANARFPSGRGEPTDNDRERFRGPGERENIGSDGAALLMPPKPTDVLAPVPREPLNSLKTPSGVVEETTESDTLRVANDLLEKVYTLLQLNRGPIEKTRNDPHPGLSDRFRLQINYERLWELIGDTRPTGIRGVHYGVAVSALASTFHLLPRSKSTSKAELSSLFDHINALPAPDRRQAYLSLAQMGPDTSPSVALKIFDALGERQGAVGSIWYTAAKHLAQGARLLEEGAQFEEKFDWLLASCERSGGGEATRAHESTAIALAPLLGKVPSPERRKQKFKKLYDVFEKLWEPQSILALGSRHAARVHVALTCATVALDESDRTSEFDLLAAHPAALTPQFSEIEPQKIQFQSLAAFVLALSALPEDARATRSEQVERMFQNLPVEDRESASHAFQVMLRPGNTVAPPLTQEQREAAEAQWQALFDHE